MKNFDTDDVVDYLSRIHPMVPPPVLKRIVIHMFSRIGDAVNTGRNRVIIREADIMHIYKKPDVEALCKQFADLDETRLPTLNQLKSLKYNKKLIKKDDRKCRRKLRTSSPVEHSTSSPSIESKTSLTPDT